MCFITILPFQLALLALCKCMQFLKITDVSVSHSFPIDYERFTSPSIRLVTIRKEQSQNIHQNRQSVFIINFVLKGQPRIMIWILLIFPNDDDSS